MIKMQHAAERLNFQMVNKKNYTSFLCLPSGSEALLYHLSELKGMALWKQKYESLGLDASGIDGTVVCVCYLPALISLVQA